MAQISSDLVKQAIFEELQQILNPNGDVRKAAEERLAQLKFTEWYGVHLAEFTVDQNMDLALRQLASVMLKQYVEDCWTVTEGATEGENLLQVNSEAKQCIKTILPQGLYDPNSKIRSVVAYSISNIASYDWPNEWRELFDIIVKCLGGTENSVHGAMKVLVEFSLELDTQIVDVGPLILSEVYRIFEAETTYSVQARSYAVIILNSLLRCVTIHIPSRQEQASILNPILPSFVQRMIQGLTTPNGDLSSFHLKTQIIKVLKYMISEMPKFVNQYLSAILPPIWQLLTQLADFYVKVIVNETQPAPLSPNPEVDEVEDFLQMILQIFEFVHTIIEAKKYRSAVSNVLTDLVYIIVLYMQMTEEQAFSWQEDPDRFVEDDAEQAVEFTVRTSAHDVLLIIGQEYEKSLLQSLSDAVSKHIAVADADRNAGSPHWWKIHEASMLAVGSFKDLIVESGTGFDLVQYMNLIKILMEHQAYPYLLGRCLWVLSRFSDCSNFCIQFMHQVVEVTENSMAEEKPIVLRISAARAIYGFCTNLKDCNDERQALMVSKLESLFESLVPLFNQSQPSVLYLLLETLAAIISYDVNLTMVISGKVISLTMAMLLKNHDDRYMIELVKDILKILSQNPYCLRPLQERIIPTLVQMLNSDSKETSMQEIALDMLQTTVKYSQAPLADNMIENAFPSAVHCILRSEDHSVMQTGGECLRTFLSVAPEQVCSYKNGEGLNYVMQVTTMLLNPMNTETTASFIGRLVITIITKIGNLLGDNIDLLLKAVISKMQLVQSLSVMMSLVTIFAHLILVQMDAVLNFLSTVPGPNGETAMAFVLTNWLTRQNMFYGQYERKVTNLALCKLFEYGVTTKDERVNSVIIKEQIDVNDGRRTRSADVKLPLKWVEIPVLLKIFKLLLHELSYQREVKDATNNDVDGDSDASDDSGDGNTGMSLSSVMRLYEEENDEDDDDDDGQLMQELMQNPLFQCDTADYLVKFVESFSHDEHFQVFLAQLNEQEKKILEGLNIQLV